MSRSTSTVMRMAVAVAVLLFVVGFNLAVFTWLYAPVMLAFEFTVLVFVTIAAVIVRNSCLCRARGQ